MSISMSMIYEFSKYPVRIIVYEKFRCCEKPILYGRLLCLSESRVHW